MELQAANRRGDNPRATDDACGVLRSAEATARTIDLRAKNGPLLLAERARKTPNDVAHRAKKRGIYQECTWYSYAEQAGRLALALGSLGLGQGDRLAIMGDPFEEWGACDLGAQALGAITYGLYPTASAAEVEYQLCNGGATIFIAENQQYVDKVLEVLERLPALRWVIVIDNSAMFAYEHPKLKSYNEILQAVEPRGEAAISVLESLAQAIDPHAPAFIVYTSGTTGHPKGAVISHGKHLASANTMVEHFPLLLEPGQRTVVYLPLCHILGRDLAITFPLISGVVPHYGESVNDLVQTLFEVAPTFLITVPRYLQKFASQLLIGIRDSSPLKRKVYEAAIRNGRAYARQRWEGTTTWTADVTYRFFQAAAFNPMLNKIGFNQLRLVICGGAALSSETGALWQIYGVNVVEIYGQTETAGAHISGQKNHFPRPGNIGLPAAGWEVRLSDNGELLARSAELFGGYWNDPDATASSIDADGWLHTGDVAELRDGCLHLVDRVRDFIVTDGGKSISPSFIENILRASPYVSEAVVFGHNRKYLTILVEIDYDAVCQWARSNDIAYTGYMSLALHSEVQKLLQQEITHANLQLARAEQIKAFRVLPKMLDPEAEGEPVTPTRKVKRNLMYERFSSLVESMYDDIEGRLVANGAGGVLSEQS